MSRWLDWLRERDAAMLLTQPLAARMLYKEIAVAADDDGRLFFGRLTMEQAVCRAVHAYRTEARLVRSYLPGLIEAGYLAQKIDCLEVVGCPTQQSSRRCERTGIGPRLRFEVLKRDGYRCRYCGCTAADSRLQVDHITPVSRGGTNEDANLITACQDCNSGKSNVLLSERLIGEGPQE